MDCATTSLRGLRLFCRAVLARLAAAASLANRLFVEAVIWKFRSGAPWRDIPERFGDWKNIHKRFSRWAASGVWESLFKTLADDPDNEYAMIDATIVRAHQPSAGARKKGVTTKPSAARAAALRRKST
jgi:transposase